MNTFTLLKPLKTQEKSNSEITLKKDCKLEKLGRKALREVYETLKDYEKDIDFERSNKKLLSDMKNSKDKLIGLILHYGLKDKNKNKDEDEDEDEDDYTDEDDIVNLDMLDLHSIFDILKSVKFTFYMNEDAYYSKKEFIKAYKSVF